MPRHIERETLPGMKRMRKRFIRGGALRVGWFRCNRARCTCDPFIQRWVVRNAGVLCDFQRLVYAPKTRDRGVANEIDCRWLRVTGAVIVREAVDFAEIRHL